GSSAAPSASRPPRGWRSSRPPPACGRHRFARSVTGRPASARLPARSLSAVPGSSSVLSLLFGSVVRTCQANVAPPPLSPPLLTGGRGAKAQIAPIFGGAIVGGWPIASGGDEHLCGYRRRRIPRLPPLRAPAREGAPGDLHRQLGDRLAAEHRAHSGRD